MTRGGKIKSYIPNPNSADPCVIPRNLLVKIDFIVLSGRFRCQ